MFLLREYRLVVLESNSSYEEFVWVSRDSDSGNKLEGNLYLFVI